MNKTKIEWVKNPDGTLGYTWNPITGCLNGCPYCYARRLANGRLKQRYLANKKCAPVLEKPMHYIPSPANQRDPFYPRFWEERLDSPNPAPHNRLSWTFLAKGIFVCDMGELFGNWIPKEWQDKVFYVIRKNPWHRFYLLTKQPQNLIKFLGGNITNTHQGYRRPQPLPDNCWAGVTVTNRQQAYGAKDFLSEVEATVKFLSLEPLLEKMDGDALENVITRANWLIIGAVTGSLEDIKKMLMEYPQLTLMPYDKKWTLQPKVEWVEEIVKVADKAGIPVFLKNNLKPMFGVMTSTEAIKYGDLNKSHLIEEITFNGDNKIIAHKLRQEMPK